MKPDKSNCPPSKKLITDGIKWPEYMRGAAFLNEIWRKTAARPFVSKFEAFLGL
jgi:hypothetical protein